MTAVKKIQHPAMHIGFCYYVNNISKSLQKPGLGAEESTTRFSTLHFHYCY